MLWENGGPDSWLGRARDVSLSCDFGYRLRSDLHLLPGQPKQHGGIAHVNRLFIDAVLCAAHWYSLGGFAGAFRQMESHLALVRPLDQESPLAPHPAAAPPPGYVHAVLRLHRCSCASLHGGREKRWDGCVGQSEQDLGHRRGGFGTDIHGRFDGLGHPVELRLSAAQVLDLGQAEAWRAAPLPEVAIADKGYHQQVLVETIESRCADAVTPKRKHNKVQRDVNQCWYKPWNMCEWFWSKVK